MQKNNFKDIVDPIPLVSISITTYEHVNYIGKCIEGVLKQKVNFPIEIIIGEDDSSDGTKEICESYQIRYPNLINLQLRSRSDVIKIGNRVTGRYNFIENLKLCKGKYIVCLDGDDYWTDENLLQNQFNFLESNADYNIVGYNAYIHNKVETNNAFKVYKEKQYEYTAENFLLFNPFIKSFTMFRKEDFSFIYKVINETLVADWPLFTFLSYKGKGVFINKPSGFYRIHSQSISYNYSRIRSQKVRDYISRLQHAIYWNTYFNNKFENTVNIITRRRSLQICKMTIRDFNFSTTLKYIDYVRTSDVKKYRFIFIFFKSIKKILY